MKLVILVGLPGSGKSTWLAENHLPAISSDAVREMLTGDATNQSINRLVFQTMRSLARTRIAAGAAITYIDSTALAIWERRAWIRFAQLSDCKIEAIYFDVPLEECLRRNSARQRVVPADAMAKMAGRLVPPSIQEGFHRVSTVSG